jgi:hypothetical protein
VVIQPAAVRFRNRHETIGTDRLSADLGAKILQHGAMTIEPHPRCDVPQRRERTHGSRGRVRQRQNTFQTLVGLEFHGRVQLSFRG